MNDTSTALATRPIAEGDALVAMIERAARDQNIDIDKLDRLLVMAEHQRTQAAERAFNGAMAVAQAEMGSITVDSNNKQTSSKYASYAAVDKAVRPIYSRHGFALSFNTAETAPAELMVRVLCDVSHAGGHVRRYHIDMPIDGKGAKGGDVMTKTHATGSGVSYGIRYLVRMIFNLSIDKDDDGNAASGQQQQRRAEPPKRAETRSDEPSPPINTSKPHPLIPLSPETAEAWGMRFIAFIEPCSSADELAKWQKMNAEHLDKVKVVCAKDTSRQVHAKIEAAFARCKERIQAKAPTQQPQDAPTEAASASKSEGQSDAPSRETTPQTPPAAKDDRFPTPWARQTPEAYVTWALRWMAAAPDAATPDNEAIDKRWSDERKIRNGLSEAISEDYMGDLHEARGDAKARAKAAPFVAPTASNALAASAGGSRKPAVVITDPEGFRKGFAAVLKDAKTPEEADRLFARDVEPHLAAMLQPDIDDLMEMLSKRKTELKP